MYSYNQSAMLPVTEGVSTESHAILFPLSREAAKTMFKVNIFLYVGFSRGCRSRERLLQHKHNVTAERTNYVPTVSSAGESGVVSVVFNSFESRLMHCLVLKENEKAITFNSLNKNSQRLSFHNKRNPVQCCQNLL